MKRILFSILTLILQFFTPLKAQDYYSDIYFFSEFSPTFPTDKNRFLINPYQSRSLEWRNKIGLRTFGNLFIGINGSIRKYHQLERAIYPAPGNISTSYSYTINNMLWGLGPFATKLFEINEKLYFSVSGVANLEQGKGRILIDGEKGCLNCIDFLENNSTINTRTTIVDRSFRELTLSTQFELGMAYLFTPKIAIHLGMMMARYERFSSATGRTVLDNPLETGAERNFNDSARGVSTFMQRPNFNLGIIGALGRDKF